MAISFYIFRLNMSNWKKLSCLLDYSRQLNIEIRSAAADFTFYFDIVIELLSIEKKPTVYS